MRPLRNWLTVERSKLCEPSIIYTPAADQRESLVGVVQAVGEGVIRKPGARLRPLDVKPGDKVVYSSRIDKYRVGDVVIDVIEEGSVIGRL